MELCRNGNQKKLMARPRLETKGQSNLTLLCISTLCIPGYLLLYCYVLHHGTRGNKGNPQGTKQQESRGCPRTRGCPMTKNSENLQDTPVNRQHQGVPKSRGHPRININQRIPQDQEQGNAREYPSTKKLYTLRYTSGDVTRRYWGTDHDYKLAESQGYHRDEGIPKDQELVETGVIHKTRNNTNLRVTPGLKTQRSQRTSRLLEDTRGYLKTRNQENQGTTPGVGSRQKLDDTHG